jgi:hypothetical protein
VASLIDACLSRDPDMRPTDAAAIASVLRDAIAGDHARLQNDLAAHMERCFADRKKKSEALLELFNVTEEPTLPVSRSDASGEVTVPDKGIHVEIETLEPSDGGAPRRRWPAVVTLSLVAIALVAAVVLTQGTPIADTRAESVPAQAPARERASPSIDPRPRDVPSRETGATDATRVEAIEGAPPPVDTIHVSIGARVRRVRVGGVVREDRPLALEIPRGEKVVVELIGRGRTVRREVDASDDGARLDVPRSASAQGGGGDALMESPY